ncbi:MAG: helix-turn-helix transcriptional regulator [Bacteroidota bacterium]
MKYIQALFFISLPSKKKGEMATAKEKIGRNIKKIRELRDLKQDHIAFELGVSQANYSDIERGKVEVSFTTLEKIAGVLGVSPSALIEFDEQFIFNNYNGQGSQNTNCAVTVSDTSKLERLYEDKTKLLEDKIKYLEEKIAWLESQAKK